MRKKTDIVGFVFRLPADLHQWLKEEMAIEGITDRTFYMRRMLKGYLTEKRVSRLHRGKAKTQRG